MQVRRNYSQPFFRDKPKRRPWRWLLLAIVIGVIMSLVVRLATEPEQMMAEASGIVQTLTAPEPTATPLAEEIVVQARQLYREGALEDTATLFAKVVTQRPDNIAYLYEYGQLLIDMDMPEEALALAEQIKTLSPGDVRGLTLQTRSMVWMGDATAAIPIGLTGLQRDPAFGALYAALSRAYVNTQQWREGLDAGQRAIELAPDDMHTHWAYAYALRSVAAYDESILELERATELNPGFIPPYMELAFLYLSLDRDLEAIEIYNRVVGLQPRNARALMRLCDAYRKIGEFEQALGRCEDAVNADPDYAAAQFRLGTLLYNRREFDRARQAFQACVDLDEGSLICSYRLGLSHYYLAGETFITCNTEGIAAESCDHTQHCDAAWTLLQDALLMAEIQTDTDSDRAIIREGLSALTSDPACSGYSGQSIPTPESTPETTGI